MRRVTMTPFCVSAKDSPTDRPDIQLFGTAGMSSEDGLYRLFARAMNLGWRYQAESLVRRHSDPSSSESYGNSVNSQATCWSPNRAQENPPLIAEDHSECLHRKSGWHMIGT